MASTQMPLNNLLKNYSKNDKRLLSWTDITINAFEECKKKLSEATLLCHPDPTATLALHVDASDIAIGGALHQSTKQCLQPFVFFLRNCLLLNTVIQHMTENS